MPIGWVEVLEGSTDVGCTGTSVPIGWVEVLEVLRMLDAQVLVCQSVGLRCWKFYGCCMHRYLCAYKLG